MMKLTIALIFAFLSDHCCLCRNLQLFMQGLLISDHCYRRLRRMRCLDGKTYPLRVDDNKNVLEWRGKIQPDRAA